jgi:hypothetical protein
VKYRRYYGRGVAAERAPLFEELLKIALEECGYKEDKDYIHQASYCKLTIHPEKFGKVKLFHVPDFFLFIDNKLIEIFVTNQRTYENSGDVFKETVGEVLESKMKLDNLYTCLFLFGKRCGWVNWIHDGFSLIFDKVFYPEYEAYSKPKPAYTWTGVRTCESNPQIGIISTMFDIMDYLSKNSPKDLTSIAKGIKEKRIEIFLKPALDQLVKEGIVRKQAESYEIVDKNIIKLFTQGKLEFHTLLLELCEHVSSFNKLMKALVEEVNSLKDIKPNLLLTQIWDIERRRYKNLYKNGIVTKILKPVDIPSIHENLLKLFTLRDEEIEFLEKLSKIDVEQTEKMLKDKNIQHILSSLEFKGFIASEHNKRISIKDSNFVKSIHYMLPFMKIIKKEISNIYPLIARLSNIDEEFKKVDVCFRIVGNPPQLDKTVSALYECSRNQKYEGFEDKDNWILKILLEACELAQTDAATLATELAHKDGIKLNITEAGLVSTSLSKEASYYLSIVICNRLKKSVILENVKQRYLDRLFHEASKEIRFTEFLINLKLRSLQEKLKKKGIDFQIFQNKPIDTFYTSILPIEHGGESIRQLFYLKWKNKEIIINSRHARPDSVQHRGAEEVGKRFALSYKVKKEDNGKLQIEPIKDRYFVFVIDGYWRELDCLRLIEGGFDAVFQIEPLEKEWELCKFIERIFGGKDE